MRWSVFADLSRQLSDTEQGAMFESLERLVPDGGCIGPERTSYQVSSFFLSWSGFTFA